MLLTTAAAFVLLSISSPVVSSIAHHGGYHHQNDPLKFANRIGSPFPDTQNALQERLASPAWPSSNSHWEGIPSTFDSSKSWGSWGSSAGQLHSVQQDVYGGGESSAQPFKRHIPSYTSQAHKPSSTYSGSSFESTPPFDDPAPPQPQTRPQQPSSSLAYFHTPYQQTSSVVRDGINRPQDAFSNAFSTGFEHFKQQNSQDNDGNSYRPPPPPPPPGQHSGFQRPSTTFSSRNPYEVQITEPHHQGDTEDVEEDFDLTETGPGFSFPADFQSFNPSEEEDDFEYEPAKGYQPHSPPAQSQRYPPSSPGASQPEYQSPKRPVFRAPEQSNVNFGQSYSTFSSPDFSHTTNFESSPEEESVDEENSYYTANQQPPAPVYHPKTRNPAPVSRHAKPGQGQQQPPVHHHTPQSSINYGSHVRLPLQNGQQQQQQQQQQQDEPEYFEEDFDDYDVDRQKGFEGSERFSHSDGGKDSVNYRLKDYRKPIQRIYSPERPYHDEDSHGDDFGYVEAFAGEVNSDRYNPREYANDDMPIPTAESEYEEDDGEPERGSRTPKRRRKYADDRHPNDEDEEGYYVPQEAMEEADESLDIDESELNGRNNYELRGGRYREVRAKKRPHHHHHHRRQQQQQQQQQQPGQKRPRFQSKFNSELKKKSARMAANEDNNNKENESAGGMHQFFDSEQDIGEKMAAMYAERPWPKVLPS